MKFFCTEYERGLQMTKHRRVYVSFLFASVILLSLISGPLLGGELPGKCRLVPVNGSCKAAMDKYYFDQKTSLCKKYLYDGCGTVVPFDTIAECQALCETAAAAGEGTKKSEVKPGDKSRSGLAYDPVEDDPRYAGVFKNIDDEVKKILADHPQRGGEGFVNIYWETKKNLLKQKYGIDWRSPGEMNPHVIFD
jgi:hypothetical protein